MKKKLFTMAIIGLIFAGLLFYFIFDIEDDTSSVSKQDGPSQTQKMAKGSKSTKVNKPQKKRTQKNTQGKADISFEEYDQLLKKQEPIIMERHSNKYSCSNKGAKFGYTYIEFVFLERNDDGTLKPYEIDRLEYKITQEDECKGEFKYKIPSVSHYKKSFRVRFPIIKDCEGCSKEFEPEETFKITGFLLGRYMEEVNYTIKLPSEDKFNFVSSNSNKNTEVYHFPILVNDIRNAIKNEERTARKKLSLRVRNAVDSIPRSRVGKISKIIVAYKVDNYITSSKGLSKDGKYTLNINWPEGQKVFGGDIIIFGQLNDPNQKGKRIGKQLLMYKTDVQSKQIDMSKGLAYRHVSGKTVVKEISMEPYLKKNEGVKPSKSDHFEVHLKKMVGNQKKSIEVCTTNLYRKDGKWMTKLEALPGKYRLVIGQEIIDKHFKWPPKD